MEIVLDVAFVVAVVAFIKTQFEVTGKAVLFWAFVVCLVIGFAPLVAGLIPAISPFLEVLIKVVVLFLSAAGSWDAVRGIQKKQSK